MVALHHMPQMGAKFKNSSSSTIRKPTKLTLWEEFIDLYGNKLLTHLKELQEFPVIVARKVAKPKSSSGLSNRFGTTIQIDPPYPQAIALKTWAKYSTCKLNCQYPMKLNDYVS